MIEPTWQSGDVQLYLGDCLEVMRGMADKSGEEDEADRLRDKGDTAFVRAIRVFDNIKQQQKKG